MSPFRILGLPDDAAGIFALLGGTSLNQTAQLNVDDFGSILVNSATPIPAALPLFLTALTGLGFAAWRRGGRSTAA